MFFKDITTYELIEAISITESFCGWEDVVKKPVL